MKRKFGQSFLIGLGFVLGATVMVTIMFATCAFMLGDRVDFISINFENNTDQNLSIIYRGNDDAYWFEAGHIAPDETRKIEIESLDFIGGLDYVIKALDTSGKVIYSTEFTEQELMELDYKVVIPPLDG